MAVTDDTGTSTATEAASLLSLAVPLVAAQIAGVAMVATDTAFLGRLGPTVLAGGGLAAAVYTTAYVVASATLSVVSPRATAARARDGAAGLERVARQGFAAALFLGVLGFIGLRFVGRVLPSFGITGETLEAARAFLRAISWSLPVGLLATVLRHVLTAVGRVRVVMVGAVLGAVANAALDYLLVSGPFGLPQLGAAGVGLATLVVNALVFAWLLVAARHVTGGRPFYERNEADGWFRDILRPGLPVALAVGAEVSVFQLAGLAVARDGTMALAAHHVCLTVVTMTFLVPHGIAQAASVRVAEAQATGGCASSRRSGVVALALVVSAATCSSIVLATWPDRIARVFMDSGAAELAPMLERVRVPLLLAALFQLFDGMQIVASGCLRGLADTKVPSVVAGASYLLLAPATAALAAMLGSDRLTSVWVGFAAALAVVSVCLVVRFLRQTNASGASS